MQARASRLSFADILKRLAALPSTDPIFISKQASYHFCSVVRLPEQSAAAPRVGMHSTALGPP